jgi:imidazolonepropionase-like amidohydrolase
MPLATSRLPRARQFLPLLLAAAAVSSQAHAGVAGTAAAVADGTNAALPAPTLCLALNAKLDAAERENRVIAITGGTIITAAGPVISDGVLLIRAGKLIAVGARAEVAVPTDAYTIDASGKIIMPGLVDTHSHIGGVAGADSSGTIQPDVRVYDSINISDPGFRRAAAGGITTMNIMPGSGHLLSGQTVYVKNKRIPGAPKDSPNHIARVEDLAFTFPEGTPAGGMKMANGTNPMREPPFAGTRSKAAAMVRQSYIKAQEYRQKFADAMKPAAAPAAGAANALAVSVLDTDKLPPRDLAMEGLVDVLTGKRIVHHHTHRADDLMTVLRLAEEFKFTTVLHHVSEAWAVADEIAAAQKAGRTLGCSVILVDSPGGKLEASGMKSETAAILNAAGVRVAFHTDDYITDSRMFLRMAALGVRAGLPRDAAFKALTIHGAEMMGLEGRVGSLVPGKDADFVILSGDPLSVYTKVERTFVDGRCIFDLADPADRTFAVGGYGAGSDTAPYLCCQRSDAWTWRSGSSGAASGGDDAR